ncbi:MAG: hypothetical protein M3552_04990, partial [Planctomycetota bacterium]|nr:hypothetical protein [Planctomycetota bacterium]
MTRAAWAWAAAASCLLVTGGGCSHPAPYAPNYGYPTYPAQPGAYPAAPGGSYVVPGGTMPGTLGAPSSTYPSGPGPTLAPPINGGAGGDAPPYTFDPNSTSPGAVPNYEDPSAGDFGTSPGGVPDDGFRTPQGNGANSSPFYPSSSAVPRRIEFEQASRPRGEARPDYLAGVENYDVSSQKVSPVGFEQAPKANEDFGFDPITSPSQPVASQQSPAEDEGFDYERTHYRWLRGVVDYDPIRKNWHIIYGLTPDAADKFGGSLT